MTALTPAVLQTIRDVDLWLDGAVDPLYREQPMAQDWARVSKVVEEAGEAIDAMIGCTGQNPRKGYYSSTADLLAELADTALTAILAIQHFTKDTERTQAVVSASFDKVAARASDYVEAL